MRFNNKLPSYNGNTDHTYNEHAHVYNEAKLHKMICTCLLWYKSIKP